MYMETQCLHNNFQSRNLWKQQLYLMFATYMETQCLHNNFQSRKQQLYLMFATYMETQYLHYILVKRFVQET